MEVQELSNPANHASRPCAAPTAPPVAVLRPPCFNSIKLRSRYELPNLTPSAANLVALQLTREQWAIVTRGKTQRPTAKEWRHEMRHEAQQVLDFISMGSMTAISDLDYLVKKQVTMVVVVRHPGITHESGYLQRARSVCNVQVHFVGFDQHGFVGGLASIIHTLNTHMIHVNSQVDETGVRRNGHILVTCHTGNDHAPAIVSAYIMAMYGMQMPPATEFVFFHRTSCAFSDTMKFVLWNWENALTAAQLEVAQREAAQRESTPRIPKRRVDDAGLDSDQGPQKFIRHADDAGLGFNQDAQVSMEVDMK